jgi:glycosyltransferase involved in cell wall biosynthesis
VRIALASQEYPPQTAKGGIGSQTRLKAQGLAALGHEVHVISRSTDGQCRTYREGAVAVTRIPGFDAHLPGYTTPVQWLMYSMAVAAAVRDLHTRAPLDILDFPEWGGEGYIHLLNRTESNDVPTVIQLHGPLVMFAHAIGWPEIDSQFYQVGTAMEGTCLRLADGVFSSSRCSADWCARHYHLRREQIPVLHAGVDTRLFSPRDEPKEERPTILFVGSIVRNKGVELLLDAAVRLAAECPTVRLRIVGRGEPGFVENLQTTARAAGFSNLLDFPGYVAHEDLPSHLARAHVFAAPSVYEGGPGMAYLEAMACGLPVIGCRGSGVAEVVRPGVTGVLVPPGDVEALTDALRRLLEDPDAGAALGARARRFVLAEASSETCVRRIEAFYTDVLQARRQGRHMGIVAARAEARTRATESLMVP